MRKTLKQNNLFITMALYVIVGLLTSSQGVRDE